MSLPLVRSELGEALQRRVTMNVTALIEKAAKRPCVLAHSIQYFTSAVEYALCGPASGQQCRKGDRTQYLFHDVISYFFAFVRLTPVGCQEISVFLFGSKVLKPVGFRYWGVMGRTKFMNKTTMQKESLPLASIAQYKIYEDV